MSGVFPQEQRGCVLCSIDGYRGGSGVRGGGTGPLPVPPDAHPETVGVLHVHSADDTHDAGGE